MNKNVQMKDGQSNVLSFIPTGGFYFEKGVKAFQSGDYFHAKKYLKRACQLEPQEPVFACQYAIVLSECEEYERSNQILFKVINEIDPKMYECYYFLANNYAYLGMYNEAVDFGILYLKHVPNGEFATDTRELLDILSAEDLDLDGDFLFDEELEMENMLISQQEQAKTLLQSGQLNEAVEVLGEIIKDFPTYWPAHNNLALAYFYEGKTKKAISLTKQVLQENPGNLHALCNLTVFHYLNGQDITELLAMLKKVFPMSDDHRYKLGVTYVMVGEYEMGYKWLKTILNVASNMDSTFYYWFSHAAYHLGKKEIAEKAWKVLLRVHPEKEGMEPWKVKEHPVFFK